MKQINLEEMKQNIKDKLFYKVENFLTKEEIEKIKEERDSIFDDYSENLVRERLFYKREDSHNRQGDALMVSLKQNQFLPNFVFNQHQDIIIRDLLSVYHSCLETLTNKKVEETSRSMLNSQQYFEGSQVVKKEDVLDIIKTRYSLFDDFESVKDFLKI